MFTRSVLKSVLAACFAFLVGRPAMLLSYACAQAWRMRVYETDVGDQTAAGREFPLALINRYSTEAS